MNYTLIQNNCDKPLNTIQKILYNRGIKYEDMQTYLNPQSDALENPLTIMNIKEGADMLLRHINNESKILVIVDSDCDGMTSSALLINYLNCLYPNFVQNNIDYRLHTGKQHGLSDLDLPDVASKYKLVITPDASSNDYYEHQVLKELGTEVLVIDHHEADQVSQYACVINNQLCNYKTKSLSGVGMVWKFCCYLDSINNIDYANNFLDLVTLGLVADMMDLRDIETRYLVHLGLNSKPNNPFYTTMLEKQDYSISKKGGLSPFTIGFYIAPFVNAVTRVGTDDEKKIVFESMLDFKGFEEVDSDKRGSKRGDKEPLAEQAARICVNVKKRQGVEVDKSLELIENMIVEDNLLDNKILIVRIKKEFALERNITGLVANKLIGEYQRPVLILNERIGSDGGKTWEGSGRAPSDSQFVGLRTFLKESNLVFLAEGHQNALGVGITDEDLPKFIEYSNNALRNCDFSRCYKVDFIWDAAFFDTRDILDIAQLNQIWGQEVTQPLVAIVNIKVYAGDIQLLKETTLKISLPNGVSLIKFGSSQEEYDSLYSDKGAKIITVVGECKQNIWNGTITPQIEVKDFELTGEQKFYF